MAGLAYDKRGVGQSTGDWEVADFDDLAEDSLAGLHMLRDREDIDGAQVGLWGASQGGWIGPLAASRSRNVAFVIAVSGPGITPHAQNLFNFNGQMLATVKPDAELLDAIAVYERLVEAGRRFVKTGQGWGDVEGLFFRCMESRLFPEDVPPELLALDDHDRRQTLMPHVTAGVSVLDHDPVPVLEKVTCPILAIWGELDAVVPVEESKRVFDRALRSDGNNDYTLRIFQDADHELQVSSTEDPEKRKAAAGYLETMTAWLLEHVTVAGSRGEERQVPGRKDDE